MNLESASASPVLVHLGDVPLLISTPSLRGMGFQLGRLQSQFGLDDEGNARVRLADSQAWDFFHTSRSGLACLLWVALQRDQPEYGFAEAEGLADLIIEEAQDEAKLPELLPLFSVLNERGLIGSQTGQTSHFEDLDFAEICNRPSMRRFTPEMVAAMTLEQLAMIAAVPTDDDDLPPDSDSNPQQPDGSPSHGSSFEWFKRITNPMDAVVSRSETWQKN